MQNQVVEYETKTTCPYCGVGCGVVAKTRVEQNNNGEQVIQLVGIQGDPEHPANLGRLCSKGSQLMQTADPAVYEAVRATEPMLRTHKADVVQSADWHTATDYVAERFAQIIAEHGPDSVAFYISGQLLTEDYYIFNKLSKGLIGTNNIDTNSRLCMSSAVSGYKRTLGADAPPCSYEDIEHADCVFIAGSNMAFAHPVAYRRLEAARAHNPEHKLIVVDPRRTDTAAMADLHLAIQPGTDVMLFNAMLNTMLTMGWVDGEFISQHTEGFTEFSKNIEKYPVSLAAQVCGVSEADIIQAATWFAKSEKTLSMYCQGLNQATTGTDKNTSLIALHLATGKIGKLGCGPFSLTGQPNAMGGREVGGMATLLPAHRELSNPQHLKEVADLWGVYSINPNAGATAVELFQKLERGEIKAVWIACTNPVNSLPNSAQVRRALDQAEFVVVQDAYLSPATVQYADVLLPASTWGEKEGTVTNSERRITRVHSALPNFAQSRHDWKIVLDIARSLEIKLREKGLPCRTIDAGSLFPWNDVEGIFNEHKRTTKGRDLDISGLSYLILDEVGPQQWPFPEGAKQGKARLYEDGVYPTHTGKAQFVIAEFEPVAEDADARYPWRLNTGRLRDQWHGGGRTGTLASFFGHEPEPRVSMNPNDCKRLMLDQDSWAMVQTRRGMQAFKVFVDSSVSANQVYVPMHWGPEYLGGRDLAGGVNALTLDAVDPFSKQPELKHSAAKVSKVNAPWECVIFVQTPSWLRIWLNSRRLFDQFDAAYCVPMGRDVPGVLFRCCAQESPDQQVMDQLLDLFELNAPDLMHYKDSVTGAGRVVRVVREDEAIKLSGVMLAGDCRSEKWLRQFMDDQQDVTPVRKFLLAPLQSPPGVQLIQDRVVCNCTGVTESQIATDIQKCFSSPVGMSADQVLNTLKGGLGCGGQCGSCVPELKSMIASIHVQHASGKLPSADTIKTNSQATA